MPILALIALGACSSQEKAAPTSEPRPVQSEIEKPQPVPAAVQSEKTVETGIDKKIGEVKVEPESTAPAVAVTEKIQGYKTPAEYIVLQSKRFPSNVTAVSLPLDYFEQPDKSYPLVIVFGGATECAMPPKQGSLAWLHYYKTDDAVVALAGRSLETAHFRGLVTPAHLKDFNLKLRAKPYQGVILACPASPPLARLTGPELPDYEAFIIAELIPALKKHYRVKSELIGVDGVSMGGSRSMYYGFKYPEVFSSIGSVQGAFGPYLDIYRDLVTWNAEHLKHRQIQLVTSDKDVMAASVQKLHQLLISKKIPHAYLILSGPHDYIFNQGPGALSLLTFHDQVLR
jgi:hypothetical protein